MYRLIVFFIYLQKQIIMEIGTKFTFLSNGKERNALFLEEENEKIIAILCDDVKFQGIKVTIDKKQIIKIY